MVTNGHSWLSIKEYTLSEIGVFYRIIVLLEKERKIENLINNWMSTHYEHDSLMNTIKEMDNSFYKKKEHKVQSKDEIKSEWSRLASFMKQRK